MLWSRCRLLRPDVHAVRPSQRTYWRQGLKIPYYSCCWYLPSRSAGCCWWSGLPWSSLRIGLRYRNRQKRFRTSPASCRAWQSGWWQFPLLRRQIQSFWPYRSVCPTLALCRSFSMVDSWRPLWDRRRRTLFRQSAPFWSLSRWRWSFLRYPLPHRAFFSAGLPAWSLP